MTRGPPTPSAPSAALDDLGGDGAAPAQERRGFAEHAYVQIEVGPYRLALPTRSVSRVSQDVPLDAAPLAFGAPLTTAGGDEQRSEPERLEVTLGGVQLPVVDLGCRMAAAPYGAGRVLPFIVAVETTSGSSVLAADRIRYMAGGSLSSVPHFGVHEPGLFAGALRAPEGLILVLDPARIDALQRIG